MTFSLQIGLKLIIKVLFKELTIMIIIIKKMSLCIVLEAGLGNQLFSIFAGISKAIDEKREYSVYPIYNTFRKFFFNNFLKSLLFKVNPNPQVKEDEIYNEPHFHYSPIPDNCKLIKGYFQSPKYFHHNRYRIIKELEIDKYLNKNKFDFKAIGVHLRFGDFTFNQGNHLVMKPQYYMDAISKLLEKLGDDYKNYKFIVFGEKDDNDIIDDYITIFNEFFNGKIEFIKFYDLHKNLNNYEELCYMSSCSHLVISNSTFSWWGAYLSDSPDKIVICPKKWFGVNLVKVNDTKDLYPIEWIKV